MKRASTRPSQMERVNGPTAETVPPTFLERAQTSRIQEKLEIVRQITRDVQTPFMVLQISEAKKSLNYFKRYLPQIKLFYAVKAGNHPSILSCVREAGHSLDVASAGEIRMALQNGFRPDQMILANPFKTDATLAAMFNNQVPLFTADSEAELVRIARYQPKIPFRPSGLIRLKPQVTQYSRRSDENRHVQIDLAKKFGASYEEALRLIGVGLKLGLNISGVAYHIGSNCHRVKNYGDSLKLAVKVCTEAERAYGIEMRTIDIGGGFPNNAKDVLGVDGLDGFYDRLATAILAETQGRYHLMAEPGRSISGPTGTVVCRVIGRKSDQGREWLILDDGVYGYYSSVISEHAKFCYFPVDSRFYSRPDGALTKFTLAGPTCDSFDEIANSVRLPSDIGVGDLICSFDVGAYSASTACSFNGFEPGPVIVWDQTELADVDVRKKSPRRSRKTPSLRAA